MLKNQEDVETILTSKLNEKALQRLHQKLDMLDKSKSEEIRQKLKLKQAKKPEAVNEPKPRYVAMAVKKDPSTRFMLDNVKQSKSIGKTSKAILDFKKAHFYGDRIKRLPLHLLINKN